MDQSTISTDALSSERSSTSPTIAFPWGNLPEEEFYRSQGVGNRQRFFDSSRGVKLFTQCWLPLDHPRPKALICMVHGYGSDTSWTFQNSALHFTKMGYAAVASDLQGHGKSEGLQGFLPDVTGATQDCLDFFHSVSETEEFRGIPKFLYGESLGGAICLLIHFREPEEWQGAILSAAMCKISDSMRPRWPLPQILTGLAYFFPTWPIVPTLSLERAVKSPAKRDVMRQNPKRYVGKPRLGTALEMLRVTAALESRLEDVSLPVLIMHGTDDVITEPAVSIALYDQAKSRDKTLKLYKAMWHVLLQGEPDENVAIVVEDVTSWLKQRVERLDSARAPS